MLSNKQPVEQKIFTLSQVYKILEERYLYSFNHSKTKIHLLRRTLLINNNNILMLKKNPFFNLNNCTSNCLKYLKTVTHNHYQCYNFLQ